MSEAFGSNPGDNCTVDESTPLLRADALDDQDELEPEIRVHPKLAEGGIVSGPQGPGDDSVPLILDNSYIVPKGSLPDEPDATVEPELRVKARAVIPVVVSGVLHGVREEEI